MYSGYCLVLKIPSPKYLSGNSILHTGAIYFQDGSSISSGNYVTSLSLSHTPVNGVLLWHGTNDSIPNNWALCDGSNGTPDLTAHSIGGLKYIKRIY